jgi:hypothetical protein
MLEALPDDVLYGLLAWLDVRSLVRLLSVSRRLAALGSDDSLWGRRCRARFPARLVRIADWHDVASFRELYVILGIGMGGEGCTLTHPCGCTLTSASADRECSVPGRPVVVRRH